MPLIHPLVELGRALHHLRSRDSFERREQRLPLVVERLCFGAIRSRRDRRLNPASKVLPLAAVLDLIEFGRSALHALRKLGLLIGREIAVGDLLPVFYFHDSVSLTDQRAKGLGIDGLAAVDA